ncbi:MAG: RHS repeat-associated core domain-containing protein [Deltaproteobacteria bacterium]|nr:RHS repeat-associated core domain-containing protein [Deltaproteobacteria bacterium]
MRRLKERLWVLSLVFISMPIYASSEAIRTETLFYLTDHLNSARRLVDRNGAEVESFSYDPYGTVREPSLFTADNLFTGQKFDTPSNLHYYGARYLSSELGRFLSRDLVNQAGKGPPYLNPYSYALNNPQFYIDPDGRIPLIWIPIAIGLGYLLSIHDTDLNKADLAPEDRAQMIENQKTVATYAPWVMGGIASGRYVATNPASWPVVGKAANWLGEQVLEEGAPGSSWRYEGAGFVKGAGRQLFQRFRFAEGASSSYDNILMELTEESFERPLQGGFYLLEAGEESMTVMVRAERGGMESVQYYIDWTRGGKEVPAEEFMSRVVKPMKNLVEDTSVDLYVEIPVPDSDDILQGYQSMGFEKTGQGTLEKIFSRE